MKKSWLYTLLLLTVIAAAVGYGLYARKIPDVVAARPYLVVSAGEFTGLFEQDGAAANRRFDGKIIQVSGWVKDINPAGAVVLGSNSSPSEVVVGLDQRHKDDLQKVSVSEHAVFQGVYSGYEQSSGNADDLLAGLGATVQLRSAGLKRKN